MNILKNYASTLLLLGGILVGGICGVIFGEGTDIVKPVGDLFLNLMFVLIVPLVFFSVSSSICNMKQSNMVGRVIGNIIFVFIIMSVIVAFIAYLFTQLYNPLEEVDKSNFISGMVGQQSDLAKLSSGEIFVKTFTVSNFPALFSKSNLLPLIVFSIFFGLATAFAGDRGKQVSDLLNSITSVILKMMTIIMYAAPVGLGCYFAYTVGQIGEQILNGYMHVFILYMLLTLICFFGLNSIYMLLAGGTKAFVNFWRNMITPSLTAIATSSSAACIPVNMEAVCRMGAPVRIAETVVPLGTNMHKDGSVISGVIKIIFLLTIFGSEATVSSNMFMIVGAALLTAAVVGAVPSGGMTSELLMCSLFGFPPELAGTLMIIATIVDVPATLLNSTGNVVASVLVTRLTEGREWMKNAVTRNNNV